jgi:hypothetical protein
MSDHQETARRRLARLAVFVLVAAVHLALLWLPSPRLRIPRLTTRDANGSLVYLILPGRTSPPLRRESPHPRPGIPQATNAKRDPPPARPVPSDQASGEEPLRTIDWSSETELAAEQQTRLAAESHHRALDRRGPGADLNGGLAPGAKRPEFAWDHARIHRVEPIPGGGMLVWLNDRCVVAFLVILPFATCGVGKIEARGDLFDHMSDARDKAVGQGAQVP